MAHGSPQYDELRHADTHRFLQVQARHTGLGAPGTPRAAARLEGRDRRRDRAHGRRGRRPVATILDTGLMVMFRDRAALDAYQKNPHHVPVAQFGAGICEHVVAVDFLDS